MYNSLDNLICNKENGIPIKILKRFIKDLLKKIY